MKKRIHILTADQHRKLMLDPDEDYLRESHDPKYREKYFVAAPYGVSQNDRAPDSIVHPFVTCLTKYVWPVLDTTGMRIYGKPAAYFTDHETAKEWVERENASHPPPPAPPLPQPPYAIGTYFAVETVDTYADQTSTHRWEIRQVSKPASKQHKMLYQQKHYTWSEKTISVHQTREEARQRLIKLVCNK